MHTSFTGNSRRPRQVNLSGRNQNPWATVSSNPSQKSHAATGTGNALQQAQAERTRRAHERDRLHAASKIQRVWRGSVSRKCQRQLWREEWDTKEQKRASQASPLDYAQAATGFSVVQEAEEQDLRHQVRLLLSFFDVHDEVDRWRLCYTGRLCHNSLSTIETSSHALEWNIYLTRLSQSVSRTLPRATDHQQKALLLQMGIHILDEPVKLDYEQQFYNLSQCLLQNQQPVAVETTSENLQELVSKYVQALLLRRDEHAYDFLVCHIMSGFRVDNLPSMQQYIAIEKNQVAFCAAVMRVSKNLSVSQNLWILTNTITLWTGLESDDRDPEWIQAISTALNRSANEIAARIDVVDQPMSGVSSKNKAEPLPEIVRLRILKLVNQDTVKDVMHSLQTRTNSVADVAKPLSNYAVALLRAFPSRATNIRMWLFQNSPSSQASNAMSTIQYLWRASQATRVFQNISSNQTNVISTLTQPKPSSNQIGHLPVSEAEMLAWQQEWRIVLLFMELYTFILKLMDDEEFFALNDRVPTTSPLAYQFRQGALPLNDVANLGTFLKHLAFALYWNAADLAEYNEVEDSSTISALFGQSTSARLTSSAAKSSPKTLAGNDVSQSYMKGLTTGLLRMIYERDSRRPFLPDSYWLMTRHFDMQSFIPRVVAEEERRHEANAEEDEEEEEDDEADNLYLEKSHESTMPTIGSLFNIRAAHVPRSQSSRQAEQLAKQRELARKRRELQSLNPRLELLRNLPFFIPFDTRVQIFRRFVYRDQERRRNGYVEADDWRMAVAASQARDLFGHGRHHDVIGRHHADIHRGSVFDDAFDKFYGLGEALKEPIQINFIDRFGEPEAGIDGGGVTKEFLMSVTSESLDPEGEGAMFEENEQRYLFPKPTMWQQLIHALAQDGNLPGSQGYNVVMRDTLQRYEFLGRIIGKCMYEGILIDVNFAGFFLLKWALTGGTTSASKETAYRASINDLRDFDNQLYQGLLKLKNYPGDVETDFGLNFTVADTFQVDGKTVTINTDLIHNGSNEVVTNWNRLRYIDRIVRYRLQEQPRFVTTAFLKGLGQIISPMWLAMFNQNELQKLVGGDNQELDINDLRRNTSYGGLYVIGDDGLEHPIVAMFWKVLKEMTDEDRRSVLKFVTSTPRAPLLGFSHLNPKFSIRDSSEDSTRLPSASTCVNLLKLPRYSDERTMREKLLYAVNSGAGFDLS